MSYLLRVGGRVRQIELDEHICGPFPEQEWMNVIRGTGFQPRKLPYEHSTWERHARVMFLGVKPG